MFNRWLIVLTAALSTSCALPPYDPTPEALGPNPATVRVNRISGDDITASGLSILKHEVDCNKPGETTPKITALGYPENHRFKAKSKEPPYSVQVQGNQRIIIDLLFTNMFFVEKRICSMAFSFVPEAGAVYQLDRRFSTSYGTLGGCTFDIAKVVMTEQGETLEKVKDYRWGPLFGFEKEKFMCDEAGNYTWIPRKRMRAAWEKIMNATDDPPWKEANVSP